MKIEIPHDLRESIAGALRSRADWYRKDTGHCPDGIAALNRDADRLDAIADELDNNGRGLDSDDSDELDVGEAESDVADLNRQLDEAHLALMVVTGERDSARNAAAKLDEVLAAATEERRRLAALINTPRTDDFFAAVRLEAAHQIERWGVEHDAGKRPEDWIALVAYLLGKATKAHYDRDAAKLAHHIVTIAAVQLNWLRAINGESTTMRPGIADQPSDSGQLLARHAELTAENARLRKTVAELQAEAAHRQAHRQAHIKALATALADATIYAPSDDPDNLWAKPATEKP